MRAPTAQADEGEEEAAEEDHGDEDMGEEDDEQEHDEGEDFEDEEAEQEPAPQKPPKVEPPQAAQPVAQPASVKKVLPPTSYHPENSRAARLFLRLLYLQCNVLCLKRSPGVHVPISPSCWQAHIIAILSSRMEFWLNLSASEHKSWAAA